MSTVAVRGSHFALDRAGELGDPLVVVHGGFEDRRSWQLVRDELASGLVVVTYDRRGHGATVGPTRGHPLRDDLDDLAGLLETLDIYPVHLAGHGSASALALGLAAERPELVRSLLLHEPTVLSALGAERAAEGGRATVDATLESCRRLARSGSPIEAAHSYLSAFGAPSESWERLDAATREIWLANAPAWAQELDDPGYLAPDLGSLGELGLPVLVSVGERSPPSAAELSQGLVGRLPTATLVELPDVGHLPHRLAPRALAALWSRFLLDRNVPPT